MRALARTVDLCGKLSPVTTWPNSFEVQGEFDLFAALFPVFKGPFDLLLSLIAHKKLGTAGVAFAQVTDEFIAFIEAPPDLSRMTEFLVVAATLFDMRAAHLLSSVDREDNASGANLGARDLLFPRLLQYRAFKEATKHISARTGEYGSYAARDVPFEPHSASFLPELRWLTTPEDLARSAADALSSTNPTVQVAHLYDLVVPVRVQALLISSMFAEAGRIILHQFAEDAPTRAVVVPRFLALLELYRRRAAEFGQGGALGTLTIQWIDSEENIDIDVDDYMGASIAHSAMTSSPHMVAVETEGEDADE